MLSTKLRRPATPWLFLIGGLSVACGYQLLPSGGLTKPVTMLTLQVLCAVVVLAGIRRHRPVRKLAWLLLLGGQLCQIAGDVLWRIVPEVSDLTHGFPGPSDAAFVLGYICFFTSLLLLLRSRTERDRPTVIDAAVVTLGVALMSWVFLMSPVIHDSTTTVLGRVITVAYPFFDLMLLSLLVRFGFGSVTRTPALKLLMVAAGIALSADLSFALIGTFETGGFPDSLWMSIYVCLAAAALHPSMATKLQENAAPIKISRRRFTLLALAALMAPAALVIQKALGTELDVYVIAAAAAVMFLLVLGRMEGLVSHLRRAEAEKRRLLDRVVRVAEDERERIALELHDSPIQRLAGIGYRLATVSQRIKRGDNAEAEELLVTTQSELANELDGLRKMMVALRPPSLDHSGLEGALRDEANDFNRRTGISFDVSVALESPLPNGLETAIFRVTTEALRNVAQHSRCEIVHISVREDHEGIHLVIADDGVGFSVRADALTDAKDRFGLASMRQHVEMNDGRFEISSSTGHGTVLSARFATARKAA
jgi:signal transduction histidine kinase